MKYPICRISKKEPLQDKKKLYEDIYKESNNDFS